MSREVSPPKTTGTNVGGHPSVYSLSSGDIVSGPSGGRTWDLKGEGIADLSCQHPPLNRVPAQLRHFSLMTDGEISGAPLWLRLFWPSVVGKCRVDIKPYHEGRECKRWFADGVVGCENTTRYIWKEKVTELFFFPLPQLNAQLIMQGPVILLCNEYLGLWNSIITRVYTQVAAQCYAYRNSAPKFCD